MGGEVIGMASKSKFQWKQVFYPVYHFLPFYVVCSLPWTSHPCGLSRMSENTGRFHAGRLMERRRVCEVHWPIRIAPHALVLQNRLTYYMQCTALHKSGVTAKRLVEHWRREVASGSCCSHPVRLERPQVWGGVAHLAVVVLPATITA